MNSRIVERRKILLWELSHILVELEEISTTQEMEEKSVDFHPPLSIHAKQKLHQIKNMHLSLRLKSSLHV